MKLTCRTASAEDRTCSFDEVHSLHAWDVYELTFVDSRLAGDTANAATLVLADADGNTVATAALAVVPLHRDQRRGTLALTSGTFKTLYAAAKAAAVEAAKTNSAVGVVSDLSAFPATMTLVVAMNGTTYVDCSVPVVLSPVPSSVVSSTSEIDLSAYEKKPSLAASVVTLKANGTTSNNSANYRTASFTVADRSVNTVDIDLRAAAVAAGTSFDGVSGFASIGSGVEVHVVPVDADGNALMADQLTPFGCYVTFRLRTDRLDSEDVPWCTSGFSGDDSKRRILGIRVGGSTSGADDGVPVQWLRADWDGVPSAKIDGAGRLFLLHLFTVPYRPDASSSRTSATYAWYGEFLSPGSVPGTDVDSNGDKVPGVDLNTWR